MLANRRQPEHLARRDQRDGRLVAAWGEFIENRADWSWYATFTMRDGEQDELPGKPITACGTYKRYQPDPRLEAFTPSSRWLSPYRPPNRDASLAHVQRFLSELEEAAARPIGWVIAEDFGRIGGRWHCHALIAGVAHLGIYAWYQRAFQEFGRCKFARFRKGLGAPYYLAQNGLRSADGLHFGGALFHTATRLVQPAQVGKIVIAQSADVPSALYHMTHGRGRKR